MASEVFMNVPEVKTMAKTLDTVHQVLDGVDKALGMISAALKATFFVGFVGLAIANFIDGLRPQIQQISKKCESLSQAVTKSVEAYERGDTEGSNALMTARVA